LLPTLKPDYSEVIWRADILGESRDRIAASLGTTLNNVSVRGAIEILPPQFGFVSNVFHHATSFRLHHLKSPKLSSGGRSGSFSTWTLFSGGLGGSM